MKLRRAGARVAVVLFCAGAISGGASEPTSKPVDLALRDRRNATVRLRDYRDKIVVLNFWATWCGPCNAEMPLLAAAQKQYEPRGVMFIGASLDDPKTADRIPEFLSKHAVTFPVWTGATADDLAKLRMGEAVPATAFIDRGGRIVARVSGQIREAELKERIEWLLSDRTAPSPSAFVSHLGQ